jgi:hypothetical protein
VADVNHRLRARAEAEAANRAVAASEALEKLLAPAASFDGKVKLDSHAARDHAAREPAI